METNQQSITHYIIYGQTINYIERLKDELHASDYKAIKHSEGLISDEDYQHIKEERESIRAEINKVELMTEEEYRLKYPQEEETETNCRGMGGLS